MSFFFRIYRPLLFVKILASLSQNLSVEFLFSILPKENSNYKIIWSEFNKFPLLLKQVEKKLEDRNLECIKQLVNRSFDRYHITEYNNVEPFKAILYEYIKDKPKSFNSDDLYAFLKNLIDTRLKYTVENQSSHFKYRSYVF